MRTAASSSYRITNSRKSMSRWATAFAVVVLLTFFAFPGGASAASKEEAGTAVVETHVDHADHTGHAPSAKRQSPETVRVDLIDRELRDQDGRSLLFKTDVIGDRIVAMNFIFTTCTTVCPILTQIFIQVQEMLGERLGKDVVLVSVSVDPTRDTPARLKDFAERHGAKPGWSFLTGKKRDVDEVLVGLDSYSADIWAHAVKVFVGDGRYGGWTSLYGFPSPDEIVEKIDTLVEERKRREGGTHGNH